MKIWVIKQNRIRNSIVFVKNLSQFRTLLRQWKSLLDKVIDRLSTLVKEIDREVLYTDDVQESHVLYKFKKEKPFTISKDKDVFVVRGDSIEKLFRMTNFNTEEAYERFSNKHRKMGLDEELIKNGIEEGDTVRILDFEFEWTR